MKRLSCCFIALAFACATSKPGSATVDTNQNKDVVRSIYEQVLNQGRFERLDAIIAPEFVGAQGERGPAAMAQTLGGLRKAFPDIRYTLTDLLAEGDQVAVRWSWTGTHTGAFGTVAPTGKSVTDTGFAIYRLREGKVVASQMETNRLGFLLQVGVISPEQIPAGPGGRPLAPPKP